MKKALIIIDIQNDYFGNGAMALVNPEAASNNARLMLDKFRKENLPIVHLQHISLRPGATFFLPGTVGSKTHENVAPLGDEKVIVKHYPK